MVAGHACALSRFGVLRFVILLFVVLRQRANQLLGVESHNLSHSTPDKRNLSAMIHERLIRFALQLFALGCFFGICAELLALFS